MHALIESIHTREIPENIVLDAAALCSFLLLANFYQVEHAVESALELLSNHIDQHNHSWKDIAEALLPVWSHNMDNVKMRKLVLKFIVQCNRDMGHLEQKFEASSVQHNAEGYKLYKDVSEIIAPLIPWFSPLDRHVWEVGTKSIDFLDNMDISTFVALVSDSRLTVSHEDTIIVACFLRAINLSTVDEDLIMATRQLMGCVRFQDLSRDMLHHIICNISSNKQDITVLTFRDWVIYMASLTSLQPEKKDYIIDNLKTDAFYHPCMYIDIESQDVFKCLNNLKISPPFFLSQFEARKKLSSYERSLLFQHTFTIGNDSSSSDQNFNSNPILRFGLLWSVHFANIQGFPHLYMHVNSNFLISSENEDEDDDGDVNSYDAVWTPYPFKLDIFNYRTNAWIELYCMNNIKQFNLPRHVILADHPSIHQSNHPWTFSVIDNDTHSRNGVTINQMDDPMYFPYLNDKHKLEVRITWTDISNTKIS